MTPAQHQKCKVVFSPATFEAVVCNFLVIHQSRALFPAGRYQTFEIGSGMS